MAKKLNYKLYRCMALVNMAKAFGQMLDAEYQSKFDRETSDLINALANWVKKFQ